MQCLEKGDYSGSQHLLRWAQWAQWGVQKWSKAQSDNGGPSHSDGVTGAYRGKQLHALVKHSIVVADILDERDGDTGLEPAKGGRLSEVIHG